MGLHDEAAELGHEEIRLNLGDEHDPAPAPEHKPVRSGFGFAESVAFALRAIRPRRREASTADAVGSRVRAASGVFPSLRTNLAPFDKLRVTTRVGHRPRRWTTMLARVTLSLSKGAETDAPSRDAASAFLDELYREVARRFSTAIRMRPSATRAASTRRSPASASKGGRTSSPACGPARRSSCAAIPRTRTTPTRSACGSAACSSAFVNREHRGAHRAEHRRRRALRRRGDGGHRRRHAQLRHQRLRHARARRRAARSRRRAAPRSATTCCARSSATRRCATRSARCSIAIDAGPQHAGRARHRPREVAVLPVSGRRARARGRREDASCSTRCARWRTTSTTRSCGGSSRSACASTARTARSTPASAPRSTRRSRPANGT